MSLLAVRTNSLGADLVGSLSAASPARVLHSAGPVVTATPVGVGVSAATIVTDATVIISVVEAASILG